jgi:hypothetical protein
MILLDGRPLPAIDVEVSHLEGAHTSIEASGSHPWSPRSHCMCDYQMTLPQPTMYFQYIHFIGKPLVDTSTVNVLA